MGDEVIAATAVAQFRAMVKGAREQITLLQNAYQGLKNWRNLGWIDTLDIVQSPWFDDLDGIDDMGAAILSTSLAADQAQGLWGDLKDLKNWKKDPRYGRDYWFRMKVRSLLRESPPSLIDLAPRAVSAGRHLEGYRGDLVGGRKPPRPDTLLAY